MSQIFHLEGTNEVNPLKDPTTVFLNGDNQADSHQGLIESQQTEEQAPLEANNLGIDSSLFSNRIENDRDDDKGIVTYEDANQQTSPYGEQTNDQYLNQTPDEEDNEPARTVVGYNNYDSNYISNSAVQGLPTLSSLLGSRLRKVDTLNSLGFKQPAVRMPYYPSLIKQLLNKAQEEEHSLNIDPEMTTGASKKDNATNSYSKTEADDSDKEEELRKQEQEYKKTVQNAELAANLAEAAKTLTKLVKKLTEHDAIIRKLEEKVAAKKNHSEGLLMYIECLILVFPPMFPIKLMT